VLSVAADSTGHRMVTTGADGQVKVWDLRTYQPLHSYFSPSPATWCDISQRGMLAVGWGRRINIWKDALTSKQQSPYMSHKLQGGQLRDFHFCPYEVGHCCKICRKEVVTQLCIALKADLIIGTYHSTCLDHAQLCSASKAHLIISTDH